MLDYTSERQKKELTRKNKEVKEESRNCALYSTLWFEKRAVAFLSNLPWMYNRAITY